MSDSQCTHRHRSRLALTLILWSFALVAALAALAALSGVVGADASVVGSAAIVLVGLGGIGLTVERRLPLVPSRWLALGCSCRTGGGGDRAANLSHDP